MQHIMDHIFSNHDRLLFLIGGIALLVELTLVDLRGPLLFFAIGSLLTGVIVAFNIINTWEMELLSIGIFTLLSSVLMWKPLKKFQLNIVDASNDMIGQTAVVSEVLTKHGGRIHCSNVSCSARLAPDSPYEKLAIGEYVEVYAVDGNTMLIK